jgi:Zn-dependent metalloprotease
MKPFKNILIFIILFSFTFFISSYAQKSGFKSDKVLNTSRVDSLTSGQLNNVKNNLYSFIGKYVKSSPSSLTLQMSQNYNLFDKQINFEKFNSILKSDKIVYDVDWKTPRLIEVFQEKSIQKTTKIDISEAEKIAKGFLILKKQILKIDDPSQEFLRLSTKQSENGIIHVRFQQMYRGLEVWAKDAYVHLDTYGNVQFYNGNISQTPFAITSVFGKITQDIAIQNTYNDLSIRVPIKKLPQFAKDISGYTEPKARRIIFHDRFRIPHLTWLVEIRPNIKDDYYYFIDAETGFIIEKYNNTKADGPTTGSGNDLNGVNRTFGTYLYNNSYYMIDASQSMYDAAKSKIPSDPVGAIQCLDLKNKDMTDNATLYFATSNNNQWQPLEISAQYNAITTYNYLKNTHKRNSVDDKGMSIFSVIHVTENNQPMDNAYWNGAFLCFGDGGQLLKPWPGTLDLSAHEVIHGVTQYSANLEYKYQSGALNESMSDVFGAMVERKNWQLGEEIVKNFTYFPSGALRDISNPHNGGNSRYDPCWQPKDMSEFVSTEEDNGGVHVNSSIPSYAFYLVATEQGKEKTEKIWYKALTSYMTRSSQFIDARITTIKAAEEIYGKDTPEVNSVKRAWDAVKVYEGSGTPEPPTTSMNGDDWILAIATDPSDPNSIYMTKPTPASAADFMPLSKTVAWSRPAVSDNGQIILFIDNNNNLRGMNSNPVNPQEQVIDNSGTWNSVAIGPGLSLVALTTKNMDKKIYLVNMTNNQTKTYELKIQSGDAPVPGPVIYADAMVFDQSGKYLLFDAYNELKDMSGGVYGYWTLNIMDVTTGQMANLFASVPDVYSVGNPAIAKTKPSRIVFDVMDESTKNIIVMTLDLNTGDLGMVGSNNAVNGNPIIGYPTFAKDDKFVAYHSVVLNNYFQPVDGIVKMPLQSDLLNGTGVPVVHSTYSTCPVWFVIGTRVGVENQTENLPLSTSLNQNYPNPFNLSTVISFELSVSSYIKLIIYDVLGREVTKLVDEFRSAGYHSIIWNAKNMASGIYYYRLEVSGVNTSHACIYNEIKKMIYLR